MSQSRRRTRDQHHDSGSAAALKAAAGTSSRGHAQEGLTRSARVGMWPASIFEKTWVPPYDTSNAPVDSRLLRIVLPALAAGREGDESGEERLVDAWIDAPAAAPPHPSRQEPACTPARDRRGWLERSSAACLPGRLTDEPGAHADGRLFLLHRQPRLGRQRDAQARQVGLGGAARHGHSHHRQLSHKERLGQGGLQGGRERGRQVGG